MSAKVKFHIKTFFLLTLVIFGVIWKGNPYHMFSPAWTMHAVIPLLIWFLVIALLLTLIIIKHSWNKNFPSAIEQNGDSILKFFSLNVRKRLFNDMMADKWAHYQAYILENIQESIIVLDTQGKVLFLNQKAQHLIGSLKKESLYHDVQDILSTNQMEFNEIKSKVLVGHSWQGETVFTLEGTSRHFMHRVDVLQENEKATGIVVISTDISELVEHREQAQAANMAKSQFLANMSHEIRTPMIGILGAVDLLEGSKIDNEQGDNIGIIRTCGEQLLGIINRILDMSKIELGLMELNPGDCNLMDMFNHVVNIAEPMLKDKNLQMKLDISPDIPPLVRIDETKLHQVLINLLYNAIKFTNRGYITVSATTEEVNNLPWLSIAIADTGIGIPYYQLQSIFDPFTQVDNSTSRQYGGTGLGLYLCKKYIDLMQGNISLTSQEGLGTTFFIKIPLEIVTSPEVTQDNNCCSDEDYEDRLLTDFTPIQILLVEDNDLNQKIVSQMLMNYGFEVTRAYNGLDCLRLMQERLFDVVLMDMQMPVMDGYEATRMIRQYGDLQNIPIIAMTANAMTGDREKCLASGCTSYIAKPFKAQELAREIRKHFQAGSSDTNNPDSELNNFINELLPEFMAQLEEMLNNLRLAIQNQDLNTIKSISHDIKGTAGIYGFRQISDIATLLEKAAQDGSFPKIKGFLDQLYQLYEQANVQAV